MARHLKRQVHAWLIGDFDLDEVCACELKIPSVLSVSSELVSCSRISLPSAMASTGLICTDEYTLPDILWTSSIWLVSPFPYCRRQREYGVSCDAHHHFNGITRLNGSKITHNVLGVFVDARNLSTIMNVFTQSAWTAVVLTAECQPPFRLMIV